MKLFYLFLLIKAALAFYQPPDDNPFKWVNRIVVPTTNDQLVKALCSTHDHSGHCNDEEPRIVLLTQIFDFRGTEGNVTEKGCWHWFRYPKCETLGQKQRNIQCEGRKPVQVTYDKAGITPLKVGSNKYIIGSNGGGLKGKGLNLKNAENVFVFNISITDINDAVMWAGDAFSMDNSTNVWMHHNYIARIGRQFVRSGPTACRNITISNNNFDGQGPHSAYCDGLHYWLWLFQGSDDTITLYNNLVQYTSGRGPHATGLKNTKVLVHILKNRFENIGDRGLVEAIDPTARILIEGNSYNNVTNIVSRPFGKIFYPFNEEDATKCQKYIGRNCYLNTVKDAGGLNFTPNEAVLQDISHYTLADTDKIDQYDEYFKSGEALNEKIYSESKDKDGSKCKDKDGSKSKVTNEEEGTSKDMNEEERPSKDESKSNDTSEDNSNSKIINEEESTSKYGSKSDDTSDDNVKGEDANEEESKSTDESK